MSYAAALVWLGFIVFPLANAFTSGGSAVRYGLTIAGAVIFIAAYLGLVFRWPHREVGRTQWLLFGVMVAVATALTVGDQPDWGFLFTYCAASTALISPVGVGFGAVLALALWAAAATAIGGGGGASVVGYGASSAGVGLLMTLLRNLRLRNQELLEARAELARLAVAEERERFARDLHDLLGHTLSVIALKAELAGRLLPDRPQEAASEVADVEAVARTALGDVRRAVSGYRQPTLSGELAGARMALSAAGIEADIEPAQVALDPEVESVLAWAVREGATNVIRHSGARHCSVKLRASLTDAEVEVLDDGPGVVGRGILGSNGIGAGHGLVGLAERAEQLRGRIEAGARAEGGFRLAVTVPVAAR
jgi:two-component system, NarL family, sensor histidine kinase DesK